MQKFKKIGIKLFEELCSRGTQCLYIEGKKMTVHNVEKSKKKKKRSNNYIQTTCTSSYHEENACKFHNNRYIKL